MNLSWLNEGVMTLMRGQGAPLAKVGGGAGMFSVQGQPAFPTDAMESSGGPEENDSAKEFFTCFVSQ